MDKKLKVLDLFSGIGGFSLGLEKAGFETAAFCEIEPFCRNVLNKHWPDVPITSDITNLTYKDGELYESGKIIYQGEIDLICGGFPCQPFSIAGRKKGKEDDRDLWPQMFRVIQEVKPTWVIGENVANFINMAFTRTKTDLESQGYTVQPFIIPACAIQAPHRRDRIWVIAYNHCNAERKARSCNGTNKEKPTSIQEKEQSRDRQTIFSGRCSGLSGDDATNSKCNRLQRELRKNSRKKKRSSKTLPLSLLQYWSEVPVPTSFVCGVDDGIPNRTHRIKSLGNAVTPQIPEIIGKAIIHQIESNQ